MILQFLAEVQAHEIGSFFHSTQLSKRIKTSYEEWYHIFSMDLIKFNWQEQLQNIRGTTNYLVVEKVSQPHSSQKQAIALPDVGVKSASSIKKYIKLANLATSNESHYIIHQARNVDQYNSQQLILSTNIFSVEYSLLMVNRSFSWWRSWRLFNMHMLHVIQMDQLVQQITCFYEMNCIFKMCRVKNSNIKLSIKSLCECRWVQGNVYAERCDDKAMQHGY